MDDDRSTGARVDELFDWVKLKEVEEVAGAKEAKWMHCHIQQNTEKGVQAGINDTVNGVNNAVNV